MSSGFRSDMGADDGSDWRVPLPFRILDGLADGLRLGRRVCLDPDELMRAACRASGLSDFGDPWFRPGLEAFAASLDRDAQLNVVGRAGLAGMVTTLLQNRLLFRAEGVAACGPVRWSRPPLFVLGLPRSGTTLLHRLLSLDPAHRCLPLWRLQRPFPPRRGPDRRRRETAKVMRLFRYLSPALRRKHATGPDAPEECIFLLNSTFVSHGLWVAAPVFSYLDWLGRCDRARAYFEFAAILDRIQREQPELRLVMKAPSHAGSLDELFDALPESLVVQTHRDPVEVLPSLNSLFCSVHAALVRRLDPLRIGRANLGMIADEMERNRAARKKWSARLWDVEFADLCSDPLGVVRGIYRHFNLPWTVEFETRVGDYLRSHPRHAHGPHRYRNADFGCTDEAVAERFRSYRVARGYSGATFPGVESTSVGTKPGG